MRDGRRANYRQRLRDQGLRPLEVWLPERMIERIDELKADGEGRAEIIAKLLAGTMEGQRPPETTNQLQLAL